jgi:formate hydrogenlyase subunit 6/NADH:ubiquinone oxidoreductase subunit I
MSSYFKNIVEALSSITAGFKLTFRYLFEATKSRKPIGIADESYFDTDKGIVTLQYPHESFPVPDNGRYRLHNEIDDCIVCDKCAKVCPVDCIDIEPIKATETIGETSDGTPKRIYAAKFDIDMAKCCFCGLCTTVCPTECLTMTKVYDFSEFDVRDHNYSFAEMSLVEIAMRRQEAEAADAIKQAAKAVTSPLPISKPEEEAQAGEVKPKPAFRPKLAKPAIKKTEESVVSEEGDQKPKPVLHPKPVWKTENEGTTEEVKKTVKPVFKPKPMVKPVIKTEEAPSEETQEIPKPVLKPKMAKPVMKKKEDEVKPEASDATEEKPKFRPRPIVKRKPSDDGDAS